MGKNGQKAAAPDAEADFSGGRFPARKSKAASSIIDVIK
jgi:hypothetical protein